MAKFAGQPRDYTNHPHIYGTSLATASLARLESADDFLINGSPGFAAHQLAAARVLALLAAAAGNLTVDLPEPLTS